MRQRSDDISGRLVILPENQFAHAAASRLAERVPPIVTISGPAGVGKSHLVRQAISDVQRQQGDLRLVHLTASELTAQLTKASHAKSLPELQESLRRADLFVCEDLQSLEGRRESQLQLLAILDEVIRQNGRVLLTCRQSPGELKRYSSKLRSRSLGGVCAAMTLPGVSSRQTLLKHFAEVHGVSLDEELAQQLAAALAVSPRELRGIVTQLQIVANQQRQAINHDVVAVVIRDAACQHQPSLSQITKLVASEFDVSVKDLLAAGRAQAVVLPRQLAMFAAREWGKRPYADVGHYFGRRCHSTIMHACQRVRERLEQDAAFRQQVDALRDQLQSP